MLAADVAACAPAVAATDTMVQSAPVSTDAYTTPAAVVFVDGEIAELDVFLESIPESSEIVLLNPDRDAIEQISATLANRQGVQSIHLIGHGQAGQIAFGDQVVDSNLLAARQPEVRAWSHALAQGADILIYGCDSGQGTAGYDFASLLANLTGADVAASTDTTGNVRDGGDWDLERHIGSIETAVVLDQFTRRNISMTLPVTIRAAGATGEESFDLQINQQTVATFNNVGGDADAGVFETFTYCLLYTSPSPRDLSTSRMPSSA